MNEESIKVLVEEYQSWSDYEIKKTYQKNNQDQYGEVAFEAMKRIAAERNITLPSQQEYIPSLKKEIPSESKSNWNKLIVITPVVLILAFYKLGYREKIFGGDKPHKYTEQNLKMEMETLSREMLPIKLDELTTIVEAWAGPGLQKNFLYEIDSSNFMRTTMRSLLENSNEIPDSAEKFLKFKRLSAIEQLKTNSMSLNHAKQGVTLRYIFKFKGDALKIGEATISPKDVLMDADLLTDDNLSNPKPFIVYPGGEEAWQFRQGIMQ